MKYPEAVEGDALAMCLYAYGACEYVSSPGAMEYIAARIVKLNRSLAAEICTLFLLGAKVCPLLGGCLCRRCWGTRYKSASTVLCDVCDGHGVRQDLGEKTLDLIQYNDN